MPKGRPRFTRSGHAFTPAKTRSYEAAIKAASKEAVERCGWVADKRDCEVSIVVNRARRIGDLENFCKSALDGMNKIVFCDDRQVRKIEAERYDGFEPAMFIQVRR